MFNIFNKQPKPVAEIPPIVNTTEVKEEKYSKGTLQEVLRNIYLQIVYQYFMAHLEHMDYIRQSVNLRAYGQRDPLVEYKKEALLTYRAMQDKMKEDFYNFIIHVDDVIANIEAQKILRESKEPSTFKWPIGIAKDQNHRFFLLNFCKEAELV